MRMLSVWLLAVGVAVNWSALAQVSATIDIDATHTTPLNANFSGFNDEVVFPAEFYDYRLNNMAAQLSPGWVRYPSGIFSDAFNWQTGMMVPAWVDAVSGHEYRYAARRGGPLGERQRRRLVCGRGEPGELSERETDRLRQRLHRYAAIGRADGGVRQGQPHPRGRVGTGQRALSLLRRSSHRPPTT